MNTRRLRGGQFADAHYEWYPVELMANGNEKIRPPGHPFPRASDEATERLATADDPITDVFLFVHGLGADSDGAVAFHEEWMEALFAERASERNVCWDGWRPMLIGLCWPSRPLELKLRLRDMHKMLSVGYHMFGMFEERAIHCGGIFGARLLKRLHQAETSRNATMAQRRLPRLPPIRYHAMGHSLGCRFLSEAVQKEGRGRECSTPLLSTLVLVQGAMPSDVFAKAKLCPNVPEWVSGTVLVTYSDTDTALRVYKKYYNDKHDALGSVGADVPLQIRVHPQPTMLNGNVVYQVHGWRRLVTNVNASAYIRTTGTDLVNYTGGHGNFRGPEVQHLIWAAVRVAYEPPSPPAGSPAPREPVAEANGAVS